MTSPLCKRAVARSLHHLPRRKINPPPRCALQRRSAATYTSPHQAAQISIIQSAVDTNSERYRNNAASMGDLTQRLASLHAEAAKGGPETARQKHVERGKMLVRDRITALVDPGTSFLELSALAGHELYPGEDSTGGAMVTGVGTVEGVMCVIIANDATYVSISFPNCQWWVQLTDQECQRWNLLPHNHQKEPSGSRNCAAKPPAVYIPRGLRWC